MIAPSAQQDETYFIRREICRKCDARVWVHYVLDDEGNEAGWGASPIGPCGKENAPEAIPAYLAFICATFLATGSRS